MKSIYFFMLASFILFIGCSRTYTVTKFPSKEDFYKDFNEFAKNKKIDVTMNSNICFLAKQATILNDSLLFFPYPSLTHKSLALQDIKQIHYRKHWPGIIPGVLIGIPAGAALAAITHIFPVYNADDPSHVGGKKYDYLSAIVIGGALGSIIGGVVGWLIGFNYTYIFSP